MSLVVIKFTLRHTNYTWFIDSSWLGLISFITTLLFLDLCKKVFKKIKEKKLTDKIAKKPRGGDDVSGNYMVLDNNYIDNCIEIGHAYEVNNPLFAHAIRKMVKEHGRGAIVISVGVLIQAYMSWVVDSEKVELGKKSIWIFEAALGIRRPDKWIVASQTVEGVAFAAFLTFLKVPKIGAFPVAYLAVVGWNVYANTINCDQFITKLESKSIEIVNEQQDHKIQRISYTDEPPERSYKVYIKSTEDDEILVPLQSSKEKCVFETKKTTNQLKTLDQETPIIQSSCKNKYIPLKYRTKTLKDLKAVNYVDGEKFHERYEKRVDSYYKTPSERYRDKREKIKAERNANQNDQEF